MKISPYFCYANNARRLTNGKYTPPYTYFFLYVDNPVDNLIFNKFGLY